MFVNTTATGPTEPCPSYRQSQNARFARGGPFGADTVSKAGSGGANAHQRLATALATSFDSLGGCNPGHLQGFFSPTAIRPSRAPMRSCSSCGCGSCQSRRFMGSALASLGYAADFKSSQSSHYQLPPHLTIPVSIASTLGLALARDRASSRSCRASAGPCRQTPGCGLRLAA